MHIIGKMKWRDNMSDVDEYEEENELTLQRAWLEQLLIEYSSPNPDGTFNENNDIRVQQLVDMVLRNALFNNGLTRIVLL